MKYLPPGLVLVHDLVDEILLLADTGPAAEMGHNLVGAGPGRLDFRENFRVVQFDILLFKYHAFGDMHGQFLAQGGDGMLAALCPVDIGARRS